MRAMRFAASSPFVAIVLAFLVPSTALAQMHDEPIGGASHHRESPQNFAVELRFAAFTPDVDSDPALGGKTPFKDTFGSGSTLSASVEFDWQMLRIPHFGTIGPALGGGYAKFSANAQFTELHNGTLTSGEQTSLEIYPFYGVAVLRADALWRDLRIPLIPYVKGGVGYALWRASTTLGTATYKGVSGTGRSMGSHVAVGLALSLNPFDEYAAKSFDDSVGVNNTVIFAEWAREDLTGLGIQKDPLRVGGTGWTFGLAFEF